VIYGAFALYYIILSRN